MKRTERSPGVNLLRESPDLVPPKAPPVAAPQPVPEPRRAPPSRPAPTPAFARRRIVVASVVATVMVATTAGLTILLYRDRPAQDPVVLGSSLPNPTQAASALVVVTSQSGEAASIVLFAGAAEQPTNLYLFPPALSLVVPGAGVVQLSSTTHLEGPQLTSLALANALGIRIDQVVGLGPGRLAAMLGTDATYELALPWLFEAGGPVATGSGGGQLFSGVQLERLLIEQAPDNPKGFLERQRAVWNALLATPVRAGLGVASPILDRLLDEPPPNAIELVPVRETTLGSTTLISFDGVRLEDFVEAQLAPIAFGSERPTVELLNGTGRAGASRQVAERLIREGYKVTRVDNADRADYPTSQVVAMGRDNLATAERVLALLGKGEVKVQERGASSAVDVSLVIGPDLAT